MGTITALQHAHHPTTDAEWQEYVKPYIYGDLVPRHFQGEANMGNAIIAAKVAISMGEDPLTTMQNMHVVNGKAGFSSSYMIARAHRSGLLRGRIRYRVDGEGSDLRVTAWARLADDPEDPIEQTVTMKMAQAEGWTKNPKYRSMPEHMLEWRAAAFLIRKFLPEVMLGFQTVEEIADVQAANVYDVRVEQRPADPLAIAEKALEEPSAEEEVAERQQRQEVVGDGWASQVEQESSQMTGEPELF